MANTVIAYQEIRFDVRDPEITHAYVLVENLSRDGFPVGGWYHKAFPATLSTHAIMQAWADGKEDPIMWASSAPPTADGAELERAALQDQVSKLEAACAAKDAAFTTAIGDCPPVPLWFNCTSTAWAGGWDAAMRRMLQAKDRTPATGKGWVDITAVPVGIWNSESQGASWGYAAELIPNGTRVALVVLPE